MTTAPKRYFNQEEHATLEEHADYKSQYVGGEISPSLGALCGTPKYDPDTRPQSLLNPQAIFEVLSPFTAAFHRGDKFE